MTGWHDARERKPKKGEKVLVVRKDYFFDMYTFDFARWDGTAWKAGSMKPTVTYWHELPTVMDDGTVVE